MLKLTTERKQWFTFPQDESGETQVEIKHLKPGEVSDIETQANRIVGRHTEDGNFNTEVDFNFSARSQMILKKCVVGFKGFEDERGKKMKCTDKNKLRLMNEFDWFFAQLEEFRTELAETVEAEVEAAKGN